MPSSRAWRSSPSSRSCWPRPCTVSCTVSTSIWPESRKTGNGPDLPDALNPGADDLMESRLLDMRDCQGGAFAAIHRDMLVLDLSQQPRWFRPLLRRSGTLQSWTGFDHWSRAWEYPWAVLAADLAPRPLRTLDVGGRGSPFALYLASQGHDSHVADPSLDRGVSFVYDREKSLARNARSILKRLI